MRILGIDPGIAITGYGIIEKEQSIYRPVACGVITTEAGLPVAQRLVTLRKELSAIIKEFAPEQAGVEQLFFAKNVKTAITVAHARGVILLTLEEHALPFGEYTPLQVKQGVSGNGRADKEQVQRMVSMILGLSSLPKPDDAADALAVALCHAQSNSFASVVRNALSKK